MSDDAISTRPAIQEPLGSSAARAHPFQFSIRNLLALTTLVAIAGAVARLVGLGTLVFSTGLIVMLLNWRGLFRPLQAGRLQRICAGAVTCLFAISLFLPAAKGCNNSRIKGWETAVMVVNEQAELIHKVATDPEVRTEALHKPLQWLAIQWYFSCLTLGNLVLASALFAPWILRRPTNRWYPLCVALGSTACWSVVWNGVDDGLLIGFWVWIASTALLVVIVPMPRRAIIAAVLWPVVMHLCSDS